MEGPSLLVFHLHLLYAVCSLHDITHQDRFALNSLPLSYNADVGPEVLVFALCGFGLEDSRRQAAKAIEKLVSSCDAEVAAVVRRARVIVTDGLRVFSRPGPWLVPSLEVLVEALHGEAQGFGHEGRFGHFGRCLQVVECDPMAPLKTHLIFD